MLIKGPDDPFLKYYHRELSYLRFSGAKFAQQHPKIARRLEIGITESQDPHVERLLESFAFLTARLSQEIDDRLPQIASALLGVLYPQLVHPLPSMAIAQFCVDPSKGKLTSGYLIPKHTPLVAYAEEGVTCRFQTSYPVTLWPLEISQVDFVESSNYLFNNRQFDNKWLIRIKLNCLGLDFSDLELDELTFHIRADRVHASLIYESLFSNKNLKVGIFDEKRGGMLLPEDSLSPVGFHQHDNLVPRPLHSHVSFQFLQEYFHLPEKFLFFKIKNLRQFTQNADQQIELLLPIEGSLLIEKSMIHKDNILLGCTPIVNLFPKISDPIRVDHRRLEYRIVPDQRRERTTEIYSIQKVSAALDEETNPITYAPYFSFDHESLTDEQNIYWISRRGEVERKDLEGSDTFLTFVDINFNPKRPPSETVYAYTLCTNRFLCDQLSTRSELQLEEKAPVSHIICLDKPVSQIYSPSDGETLWRLISELSVNHLKLTQGNHSLQALKETLRLAAGPSRKHRFDEINSILGIKTVPSVRRIGREAWRGFVEGMNIILTINERVQSGSSSFLLASVLREFFCEHVSVNSFIEVTLETPQRQGEWFKWQPLSGTQTSL